MGALKTGLTNYLTPYNEVGVVCYAINLVIWYCELAQYECKQDKESKEVYFQKEIE